MLRAILLSVVCVLAIHPRLNAQFQYEFHTTPDAADVLVNGEKRCVTPCRVSFFWKEAREHGQIKLEVKLPGYKTWVDSVTSKPRQFDHSYRLTLESMVPEIEFEKGSALVGFDKLVADDFKDGQTIGKLTLKDGTEESIKWEGSVKIGVDAFEKKFFEIGEKMGLRTPATAAAELFSDEKRRAPLLPRFVVGIKLVGYDVDMRIEKGFGRGTRDDLVGRTEMDLEWQVLDKRKGDVVLTYRNKGVTNLRQRPFQRSPNNLMAFENGLIDFFANSGFHDIVNSPGEHAALSDESDGDGPRESFTIEGITNPGFQKMSEMIQYANKACVTIITDGGHGSGAIIDKSGLVISAFHVVDGVNKIEVQFSEGLLLGAEVVAYDKKRDVVILKIAGSGFRALPVNLDDVSIGDDAVTIGTPHDLKLGQSVARGMISGKRERDDEIVLQADISVSPGNSGGPLLNENGEIIGIIQQKIVRQGVEGIGFALPIGRALEVLNVSVSE